MQTQVCNSDHHLYQWLEKSAPPHKELVPHLLLTIRMDPEFQTLAAGPLIVEIFLQSYGIGCFGKRQQEQNTRLLRTEIIS
jgi:hypothetical protein